MREVIVNEADRTILEFAKKQLDGGAPDPLKAVDYYKKHFLSVSKTGTMQEMCDATGVSSQSQSAVWLQDHHRLPPSSHGIYLGWIPLEPAVLAWLKPMAKTSGPVVEFAESAFREYRRQLLARLKITFPINALRNSYASYSYSIRSGGGGKSDGRFRGNHSPTLHRRHGTGHGLGVVWHPARWQEDRAFSERHSRLRRTNDLRCSRVVCRPYRSLPNGSTRGAFDCPPKIYIWQSRYRGHLLFANPRRTGRYYRAGGLRVSWRCYWLKSKSA